MSTSSSKAKNKLNPQQKLEKAKQKVAKSQQELAAVEKGKKAKEDKLKKEQFVQTKLVLKSEKAESKTAALDNKSDHTDEGTTKLSVYIIKWFRG
jgi:hypothetical protein